MISSSSIFCRYLRIFYIVILYKWQCCLRIKSFTPSFSFLGLSISYYCLSELAMASGTILNGSGEGRDICIVLNTKRKALRLSPLSMLLVVGFTKILFIPLRKFFSISSFLRVFLKNLHLLRWRNNFYLYLIRMKTSMGWFINIKSTVHSNNKCHLAIGFITQFGFLYLHSWRILVCDSLYFNIFKKLYYHSNIGFIKVVEKYTIFHVLKECMLNWYYFSI